MGFNERLPSCLQFPCECAESLESFLAQNLLKDQEPKGHSFKGDPCDGIFKCVTGQFEGNSVLHLAPANGTFSNQGQHV